MLIRTARCRKKTNPSKKKKKIIAFTVVFKDLCYELSRGSAEVVSVGGTHFPALERLRRPEVVFHSRPLILLLCGEQQHPKLAQLHHNKKNILFSVKIFGVLHFWHGILLFFSWHSSYISIIFTTSLQWLVRSPLFVLLLLLFSLDIICTMLCISVSIGKLLLISWP